MGCVWTLVISKFTDCSSANNTWWANYLEVSTDGCLLIAACNDMTIKFFSTNTARFFGIYRGHKQSIACLAICADSGGSPNRIASGSWDHTINLWDMPSLEVIGNIKIHPEVKLTGMGQPHGSSIPSSSSPSSSSLNHLNSSS